MAKTSQAKEIELYPDAWERFEQAVDAVAKAPPSHRKSKAKVKKRKPSGQRRKPKV